jgi:hypothetical protein
MNKFLQLFLFGMLCVGKVGAAEPDSLILFRVDSLEFKVQNTFDDAERHSKYDQSLYEFANKLRFKTRESVVRQNLLFNTGDSVSLNQLLESERVLRSQEFIAEAKISHRIGAQGENILQILTTDHWTTNIPIALSNPSGDEWLYSFGLLESNLLGFGHRLGFFYAHTEERDMTYMTWRNPHLFVKHNRLTTVVSHNTDGYLYSLELLRPFASLSDLWAWSFSADFRKQDVWVWHQNGDPIALETLNTPVLSGDSKFSEQTANPVLRYGAVRSDSLHFHVTRSFGTKLKKRIRLNWDARYMKGDPDKVTRYAYKDDENNRVVADINYYGEHPYYKDSRPGFSFILARTRYEKVSNLRTVKYTEDLDQGWSLVNTFSKNMPELGASDSRWRFLHSLQISENFWGKHFVNARLTTDYYWQPSGPGERYSFAGGEYAFKPVGRFSSHLNGFADFLENHSPVHQLTLGGIEGLAGFPSQFMVGTARYMVHAEQRYFPTFELGTVVPVFATFINGGNVYQSYDAVELKTLQYSAGLGLRLGLSKSTQGVVNHVNVSWPLNGPLQDGFSGVRFSLLAKASL